MRDPEDRSAADADDVDPSFGSEFGAEIADVIATDIYARRDSLRSAWQRLEAQREEAWLLEQLADWDDWGGAAELD